MGGRSASSTAQNSTNTDRSVVNDEGLVFADAVGSYTQSNAYTDSRDMSSFAFDASVDASDRSANLTTNTSTINTDSRDQSLYALDSSNRSVTNTDSRDQSLYALDSSNRSVTNTDSRDQSLYALDSSNRSVTNTDSRDQSIGAWDYSNRSDQSVSTVTTNTLDGGAIGGAFKFSTDMGNRALSTIDTGITRAYGAFDQLLQAAKANTAAASSETANFRADLKSAYSEATANKSGTLDNKTIMILGVAVAALLILKR